MYPITYPITRRTSSGARTTSTSAMVASPSSGSSSVARTRIVVVLPAPFWPMKP
jgi:hypothetical protein